jgi:hypothetical protein
LSDEISDLDEMLGFLAEDGRRRRDPDEHPSPEELSAYQANELSKEEDRRILDHLVICQHCTELLVDLEEFLKPPAVIAAPAADFEAPVDWRVLKDPLGPPLRTPWRKTFLFPLAASLIGTLTLLGLSSWRVLNLQREAADLRSQMAELRQPVVSPPLISLRSTRGETFELPVDRTVLLRFFTSAPDLYAEFRLQILDGDGKVLWSNTLKRDAHGDLSLVLVQGSLPPGTYVFRLAGLQGGRAEALEDYPVRVISRAYGYQGK